MPIADEAYVITVGRLQELSTDDVAPHLAAASIRLRRWVGATAYADAMAAAPQDADRAEALKLAEALLAVSILALKTAATHSGRGFVGGASLTEGEANYLTPKQLELVAKSNLAEAERLADPYLLPFAVAGGIPAGDGQ